ncbi:MAG TPA: DUF3576 domain-containing protein [Alphaproteobacteria bacterium]|nr:DUF3576 domain-containing protein [Alphaproteobacteria bacterium]
MSFGIHRSRRAMRVVAIAAGLGAALAGCSWFQTKAPLPPGTSAASTAPTMMQNSSSPTNPATPSLPAFSKGVDNTVGPRLGVNRYLWQGALDTVSFMPLLSADPFGGVIITDWYAPPETPDERFKLTVYILGRELRADAIRVALFRQKRTNGQWLDMPAEKATATDLEDTILARADKLRDQALSGNSGG